MKKLLLSFVFLMSFSAVAQQVVDQREANQQQRIEQGVKSGQLTKGEDRRLERQQGRIDRQEGRMEARDNGKLTAADQKRLRREQNRASRRIYRDKHNARVGQ